MLNLSGKQFLSLAPHIDDVEFGAGATIYQLGKDNLIYYIGLSLPPLVERETLTCRNLNLQLAT